MCASYIFHFFTKNSNLLTYEEKFNIFCIIYVAVPTLTFQVYIMSKWLAKHIRTKVSFKTTLRKIHVYIDIRWPWKWNQYFYLGIWEDERSKILLLPSFQLVTRLNSQNRNETILLMNSDTLICIWILAIPIAIILVSTPRKWSFYFISVPYTITEHNQFNLISA